MVKVKVCVGSHCSLVGALSIVDSLEELQEEYPDQIELKKVKCMDVCKESIKNSPVVQIDDEVISSAQNQVVLSKVMEKIK